MAAYRLLADGSGVMREIDSGCIPNDPANRDWQQYQEWLTTPGNMPDPAPVPPTPPSTLDTKLARVLTLLLAKGIITQAEHDAALK